HQSHGVPSGLGPRGRALGPAIPRPAALPPLAPSADEPRPEASTPIDPDTAAELRALGYVGG
ncbi:MAG: hypothetical protein OEY14_15660, partial [Myxococcales bacterium]|nr:hypothetical protein [Myxococcales bacterium]